LEVEGVGYRVSYGGDRVAPAVASTTRDADRAFRDYEGRIARLDHTPRLRDVGPAPEAQFAREPWDGSTAARLAAPLADRQHRRVVEELGYRVVVAQYERVLEHRLELLRRRRS
jgi:hypothetical protein